MLIDILGPPRLWCQTNTRRASERKALEASSTELIPLVYLPRVVTFSPFRTFHLFAEPIVVLLVSHPARIYTLRFDSCKINFSLSFLLRMLAIWPFGSLFFQFYSDAYRLTDHLEFEFTSTHTPKRPAFLRKFGRAGAINGTMQATHSRCNLIIGCALSPNWFRFLFRSQHFAR